ncbi:hypothetical protein IKI14_07490 [bacterium]|nr:hypothetical protein [bacterium]MBR7037614.1 hypothetical protein [bacterium]
MFAISYTFVVLLGAVSVIQKEANHVFRCCSLNVSGNVEEKYCALFSPYLLFNLLIAFSRKAFHALLSLNEAVIARISQTVVVELKIIIEYIDQLSAGAHSIHEFDIQVTASQKAFQNLSCNSSAENHHVMALVNKVIGHSHVSACAQNIVAAVIQALPRKLIFLFVKNLYNQKIHAA